ncbi:MAG: hypothetical protein RLZ17_737 [Actinomycetota bacterium]
MDVVEISDLCATLQNSERIEFTRLVELGDDDDMELIIDGDRFSDVVYVSVNGANMMVESTREEMRLKIIASANLRNDVMFDTLDVDFKV